MEKVTSKDGTRIAYEKSGIGPTVILVAGALTDRKEMRPLAEALSSDLTVINYDRRSRGDSEDTQTVFPESADREIEDIQALAEAAGGPVSLYGHSSGASLALEAAAVIGPEKLILHEPPYEPGEPAEGEPDPSDYNRELRTLFENDDDEGAVVLFLSTVGMPEEMIEGLKSREDWPDLVAKGRSLAYDSAAVGDARGGGIPKDLLPRVTCSTLALAGSETFPFMIEVAETLAEELAGGLCLVVQGADHEAGPDLVAPPVKAFLAG